MKIDKYQLSSAFHLSCLTTHVLREFHYFGIGHLSRVVRQSYRWQPLFFFCSATGISCNNNRPHDCLLYAINIIISISITAMRLPTLCCGLLLLAAASTFVVVVVESQDFNDDGTCQCAGENNNNNNNNADSSILISTCDPNDQDFCNQHCVNLHGSETTYLNDKCCIHAGKSASILAFEEDSKWVNRLEEFNKCTGASVRLEYLPEGEDGMAEALKRDVGEDSKYNSGATGGEGIFDAYIVQAPW